MSEAYAMAIGLIADNKVDYRELGVRLAQVNPEMFVKLVEFKPTTAANVQKAKMDREIAEMNKRGERVAAIKRCRELTGWGLKEAKDYCDDIGAVEPSVEQVGASLGDLLKIFGAVTGNAALGSVLTEAYKDKGTF